MWRKWTFCVSQNVFHETMALCEKLRFEKNKVVQYGLCCTHFHADAGLFDERNYMFNFCYSKLNGPFLHHLIIRHYIYMHIYHLFIL